MKEIKNIQSVIDEVVKELNIESKLRISRIFNNWEKIVGSVISKKARPKRLTGDTLYISVESSTWASELSLMSGQLIDKINSFIGEDLVKNLRFRQEL
ncbi:MAG: hypothetical protein AVO38_00655 [delta proteobacterium ML8_D]|jgi:predicted nucleic acid-binding Zn ribbon protein|nr:MAG: hypothetical protein AVO38_00655 [delta proteobacterium ML8_D]